MKIISHSLEETHDFAKSIAQRFKTNGGVIALIGDLGSGKTTFTKSFARSLEIQDQILSPTYVLMRQHQLPNSDRTLYHLDLYRLEEVNLEELGLTDLFHQKADIILIEWAEKLGEDLPKEALVIKFKHLGENEREIEFS